VANYGYLSGINNLAVYSALDKRFAGVFGVTEAEVSVALEKEGLGKKMVEARDFYNGYDIAGSANTTFNPWSIVNYLNDKELKPYWVLAGGTDQYERKALLGAEEDDLKKFEAIYLATRLLFLFEMIFDLIELTTPFRCGVCSFMVGTLPVVLAVLKTWWLAFRIRRSEWSLAGFGATSFSVGICASRLWRP